MLAEMRAHGFEVRDDERVRWVVIAFDRTFSYAKLNTALQAVKRGARLIATNPDRTCPVEGGEIPDCAGMIAAVEAVTDTKVEAVVGKPSPIILEVALASLGVSAADAVMVGDRIETDIAMGRRAGLHTILVLSGVTRADDPRIAESPRRSRDRIGRGADRALSEMPGVVTPRVAEGRAESVDGSMAGDAPDASHESAGPGNSMRRAH